MVRHISAMLATSDGEAPAWDRCAARRRREGELAAGASDDAGAATMAARPRATCVARIARCGDRSRGLAVLHAPAGSHGLLERNRRAGDGCSRRLRGERE